MMGWRHYLRRGTRERIMRGERVNWIENRPTREYIRRIVISMPPWLTQDHKAEIRMLAAWARTMEIMTGRPHCLDHVVPVRGETVCGLTVPWNIQVIPRKTNEGKSNKYMPEQIELFPRTPTCGID